MMKKVSTLIVLLILLSGCVQRNPCEPLLGEVSEPIGAIALLTMMFSGVYIGLTWLSSGKLDMEDETNSRLVTLFLAGVVVMMLMMIFGGMLVPKECLDYYPTM